MSRLIRYLAIAITLTIAAFTSSVASASENISARIIGGNEINISNVPSTVALLDRQNALSNGDFFQAAFCAGTVIAAHWVLTAAHCLVDYSGNPKSPDTILVLMGSTDLTTPTSKPALVKNVIVPKRYTDFTNGFDIALLELEQPASVPAVALDLRPIINWG